MTSAPNHGDELHLPETMDKGMEKIYAKVKRRERG